MSSIDFFVYIFFGLNSTHFFVEMTIWTNTQRWTRYLLWSPHLRSERQWVGAFVILASIVIGIILLALSGTRVEQNEWIFTENQIFTTLGGPYEQGFYLVKPADRILRFERIFQAETITVPCMTNDKLKFAAKISFQYVFRRELIVPTILLEFKNLDNYMVFFFQNITNSIITTCAKWNATDYYDKRALVELQLENDLLHNVNNPDSRFGADIKALQLRDIRFPSEFNSIIVRRQIIDQESVTATNARVTALISANTRLLEAQRIAAIRATEASNQAHVILDQANTTAQVRYAEWFNVVNTLLYNKQSNHLSNHRILYYLNQDTFTSKRSIIQFARNFAVVNATTL